MIPNAVIKALGKLRELRSSLFLWALFCTSVSADPLDQWSLRSFNVPTNGFQIETLAYGNGVFIAGAGRGDLGMILASTDGRSWVPVLQDSLETDVLEQRDAVFGNGIFATVTWGGDIWKSTNGIQWVRSGTFLASWLNAIAYGRSFFVAVGQDKVVYGIASFTSQFWRQGTLPPGFSYSLDDVAYGNGLFVAVGTRSFGDGVILSSSDGSLWARRGPILTNGSISSVVYGNGQFVALATAWVNNTNVSSVLISSNAIDWLSQPCPFYFPPQWSVNGYPVGSLSFINGSFIGLVDGSYPPVPQKTIYLSTNAIVWEKRTFNAPPAIQASFGPMTFGKNTFVIGGSENTIIQSDSVIQLSQPQLGSLMISGIRGWTYAVEATQNLRSTSNEWPTLATMVLTNGTAPWADTNTSSSSRFYRAAWLP